ncbi:MAG: AgmX/PglI C-terminal domain-containing protein [bacterium]
MPTDDRRLWAPTGLEDLLKLAAASGPVTEALVARRGALAETTGQSLTPSERAALAAIPEPALRQMIARVRQGQSAAERRGFLIQAGAALAALAALAAGCKPESKTAPRKKNADTPPDTPRKKPDGKPDGKPDLHLGLRPVDHPRPTKGIRPGRRHQRYQFVLERLSGAGTARQALTRLLNTRWPSIGRCLVRWRAQHPELSGRVKVGLLITHTGHTDNVTAAFHPTDPTHVGRCVEERVQRWRFPNLTGPVMVTFSIVIPTPPGSTKRP